MSRILQSKAFLRIPPANIQHMFMRLQEVPVRAGDTVITQGEDGDYYYIISRGRCKVTRESANGASVTLLADQYDLAEGLAVESGRLVLPPNCQLRIAVG